MGMIQSNKHNETVYKWRHAGLILPILCTCIISALRGILAKHENERLGLRAPQDRRDNMAWLPGHAMQWRRGFEYFKLSFNKSVLELI